MTLFVQLVRKFRVCRGRWKDRNVGVAVASLLRLSCLVRRLCKARFILNSMWLFDD